MSRCRAPDQRDPASVCATAAGIAGTAAHPRRADPGGMAAARHAAASGRPPRAARPADPAASPPGRRPIVDLSPDRRTAPAPAPSHPAAVRPALPHVVSVQRLDHGDDDPLLGPEMMQWTVAALGLGLFLWAFAAIVVALLERVERAQSAG